MKHTKTRERRSDCPISFGLDLFGDRWTLLILRDILFFGRTRFSDFAPQERIATNILADRLDRLETAGVLEKRRDEELRNQFIYSVTHKGAALLPTLIELTLWGLQHDPETLASKTFLKRAKAERGAVTSEIKQAIESGTFVEYRKKKMGI